MAQICEMDCLMRAWRKVKANGGMPGVDGENLRDFAEKLDGNLRQLQAELRSGQYQPKPIRRIWVPKENNGARPIAILTLRDRVAQRAVVEVLGPLMEKSFNACSFGFREGRSLHDAVRRVLTGRDAGKRWVVDGDIRKCFESLDHRLLLDMLARDVNDRPLLQLIERWLTAHVFNELTPSSAKQPSVGTTQGGVLSPLLCNVYLRPFDDALTRSGLALTRYADDWVILCQSKSQAQDALNRASQELGRLKLAINPHKTRVTGFEQGFCFLGVFFIRNEHFFLSPGMTTPNKG
jgi:group II intron reverse transcriptase/maturase